MNLILNLGHSSAAIGVSGDAIVGYEQERFTRIKSSSAFPADAIREVLAQMAWCKNVHVFISHWFDQFDIARWGGETRRYFDHDHLMKLLQDRNVEISQLSENLTHHDAHAYSAIKFYHKHAHPYQLGIEGHVIVADGFGNKQEVLSIYRFQVNQMGSFGLELIHRVHGYKNSLGLMYQYATSFCGMKENQDEYKFLGYETHVSDYLKTPEVERLSQMAKEWTVKMLKAPVDEFSPDRHYINVEELMNAKQYFNDTFIQVINEFSIDWKETVRNMLGKQSSQDLIMTVRSVIGFFIQTVLEHYYKMLIEAFQMENVLCAGGVHYNVKLNNSIMRHVKGYVSFVPLAGDQGAGIGLCIGEGHDLNLNGLLWGTRDLTLDLKSSLLKTYNAGIYIAHDQDDYVDFVSKHLAQDEIVNTITGAMEFGPRALCNTSTLALPTKENVDVINALNGRDTVMPFAPVMLKQALPHFFELSDVYRVIGSLRYMITTLDYSNKPDPAYEGVMHQYPGESRWSGRPQVIEPNDKVPIRDILTVLWPDHKALINTSLNIHGRPICRTVKDAIDDLRFNQQEADRLHLKKPILVIGNF